MARMAARCRSDGMMTMRYPSSRRRGTGTSGVLPPWNMLMSFGALTRRAMVSIWASLVGASTKITSAPAS